MKIKINGQFCSWKPHLTPTLESFRVSSVIVCVRVRVCFGCKLQNGVEDELSTGAMCLMRIEHVCRGCVLSRCWLVFTYRAVLAENR